MIPARRLQEPVKTETIVYHNRHLRNNNSAQKSSLNRKEQIENTKDGNSYSSEQNVERPSGGTLSLKQARFDVFKFGIQGFDKEKQQNAKIDLAVKLGADV
jgi:hypothetical protein